ncbi:hypothetical protein [Thiolapillus sp.]|uniref:hypothetical protein n=1 Tax=Thiolapillus sp. TaxID=2017437 RepID=UPI003AF78EB4
MPPANALLHSGAGIFAVILLLTLIASALTLVTSWVLLLFYKRAVGRLMSKKISSGSYMVRPVLQEKIRS